MRPTRRSTLAGAAGLLALSLGWRARAAETVQVNIPQTRTAFEPAEVSIRVGDTVRWRNRGIVEHSVICDPAKAKVAAHGGVPKGAQPFASVLGEEGVFEHRFDVAGTYLYFCGEHEEMGMLGRVIVSG